MLAPLPQGDARLAASDGFRSRSRTIAHHFLASSVGLLASSISVTGIRKPTTRTVFLLDWECEWKWKWKWKWQWQWKWEHFLASIVGLLANNVCRNANACQCGMNRCFLPSFLPLHACNMTAFGFRTTCSPCITSHAMSSRGKQTNRQVQSSELVWELRKETNKRI